MWAFLYCVNDAHVHFGLIQLCPVSRAFVPAPLVETVRKNVRVTNNQTTSLFSRIGTKSRRRAIDRSYVGKVNELDCELNG